MNPPLITHNSIFITHNSKLINKMIQKKILTIMQCGRKVTSEEIEIIKETVNLFNRLSRKELAETICEHLQWYTASGTNKAEACLKLLEKLEDKGLIELPQKKTLKPRKASSAVSFTERTDPRPEIYGTLKDIGKVKLEIVDDKESKSLWIEYMSRYHYLGYYKPFGFYMYYFIKSDNNILGCILFSGPSKSMGIRDKWIGWTNDQRSRNQAWIANNSRFLIFPWVHVRYMASHVLGLIIKNIERDWEDKWGYRPALLETFVDPKLYKGTCYKASNWICLGMTTGEGLVRKGKTYTTSPKVLFVYPLAKNFREILCKEKLVGRVF